MSKKVFVSLVPHIIGESGHDIIYQTCLESAAKDLGLSFIALFRKHTNIKHFRKSWVRFFHANRIFRFIDYCRIFLIKRKEKVFFLETFSSTDFIFLLIASILFSRKQDLLCLLFRNDLHHLPYRGKIHLFLTKIYKMKFQDRFVMCTDSELIAKDYQKHLNHRMIILPIPHTDPFISSKPKDGKIICWWPGPPREAKGLKDLFYIANLPDRDPSKMEIMAAKKSQLPNTILISDMLTREDYLAYLHNSDIILLPYHPDAYRSGTSGIFAEAVVAGKIPVVKKGSWLSYELSKYGLNELIVDWRSKTFFHNILGLMDNRPMREKLEKMRISYSAFHSPETFRKCLQILFP